MESLTAERLEELERLAHGVVSPVGKGDGFAYWCALDAFENAVDPETILALLAEREAMVDRIRKLENGPSTLTGALRRTAGHHRAMAGEWVVQGRDDLAAQHTRAAEELERRTAGGTD